MKELSKQGAGAFLCLKPCTLPLLCSQRYASGAGLMAAGLWCCGFAGHLCALPGARQGFCSASCMLQVGHAGPCKCGVHLLTPFAPPVPPVILRILGGSDGEGFRTVWEPSGAGETYMDMVELDTLQASSSRLILRDDHPPVYGPVRASRAVMATALATQQGRTEALRVLNLDTFARSSASSRSSAWRTWKFATGLWGIPPLPVTFDAIQKVAAGLKAGGYSAPRRVFTRAVQEHWEVLRSEPEPQVAYAAKLFARSIRRGRAAPKLKVAFKLEELATLDPDAIQAGEGPHHLARPLEAVILGAWWMTRGIELSAARAPELTVDTEKLEATWFLPVSKSDPEASGVSRTHGCLCNVGPGLRRICPVHVAMSYLQWLQGEFAVRVAEDPVNLPLFPSRKGSTVTKHALVTGIRAVLTAAKVQIVHENEMGEVVNRFHEHVLRMAGAQVLARAGVEVYLIQIFARWGSSTVLQYVQSEPLAHQQALAPRVAVHACQGEATDDHSAAVSVQEDISAALEARLLALEQSVVRSPRFVVNSGRETVHRVAVWGPEVHKEQWKAQCGWQFGSKQYVLRLDLPDKGTKCDRCFNGIVGNRRLFAAKVTASSSDSETGSATSTDSGASFARNVA